ncbi:MAG TPA: TVP38/TMEM64 family protein [Longimicrobiales bacterium]
MKRSRKIVFGLAAAGVIAAVLVVGGRAAAVLPELAEWVSAQGAAAPLLFGAAYVIATVLLVPGSVLTLAAGALFGLWRGTAIVLVAASVGATGAFLIARYLARARVAERVARDARFAGIDRAIGASGLKIVVLLRLSPVVPFNLLNYALGITSVRLRDFLIACIAMLPGTLLYVYYGRVVGDVAALAAGARADRDVTYYVLLGVGLLATIVVSALLARIAKRELRRTAPDAL